MSVLVFTLDNIAAVQMRVRGTMPAMLKPNMKLRTDAHRTREHKAEHQIEREQLLPTLHFRLGRDAVTQSFTSE